MWYLVAIAFVAGFAGGWAFFKHRQSIKDKALAEVKDIRSHL